MSNIGTACFYVQSRCYPCGSWSRWNHIGGSLALEKRTVNFPTQSHPQQGKSQATRSFASRAGNAASPIARNSSCDDTWDAVHRRAALHLAPDPVAVGRVCRTLECFFVSEVRPLRGYTLDWETFRDRILRNDQNPSPWELLLHKEKAKIRMFMHSHIQVEVHSIACYILPC